MDWAIQLNYYRMLLETSGFTVNRMVIQAMCRNNNLRTANERGIDRTIYIIQINKISNRWLTRYFSKKSALLQYALKNHKLPPVCNTRERWNNRKCLEFCDAKEVCPYSKEIQLAMATLKA